MQQGILVHTFRISVFAGEFFRPFYGAKMVLEQVKDFGIAHGENSITKEIVQWLPHRLSYSP